MSKNAQRPKLIFLDTCVLLEDPHVLERVRRKNGLPVISTTVLKELDKFKIGNDERAFNARETFRKIGTKCRPLKYLNGGTAVRDDDTANLFGDKDESVIVIDRKGHNRGDTNDDKIIDVAQSYDMILLSRDRALVTRAQAQGAQALFWEHKEVTQQPQAANRIPPFALASQPIATSGAILDAGKIPSTGETVFSSNGNAVQLRERVGGGGEGTIYATDASSHVAKIYEPGRVSVDKRSKVELMLTRPIDRPGICWPSTLLNDRDGNFVGYLMPRAEGRTIQSTMFVKPVLEKTFPNWKRVDLANVAISFLEHMEFLHSLNILVGDINPMNLLVLPDSTKLSIVDTDSFQIEGYPCPVGTVNFTPARRQGQSYTDYLRTKDDELFAVATMLFMILHPGKPPYAQQGGGTPSENIRNKEFAYWYKARNGDVFTAEKAPEGPWQTIWANLPWDLRGAFHESFREDRLVPISRWLQLLRKYKTEIAAGRQSNELFPRSFPVRDPVKVDCARCGTNFTGSKRQIENRQAKGFAPWCPDCFTESKLRKLANQSRQANAQNTKNYSRQAKPHRSASAFGQPSHKPPPSYANNRRQTSQPKPASNSQTATKVAAIIGAGIAALFSIFG